MVWVRAHGQSRNQVKHPLWISALSCDLSSFTPSCRSRPCHLSSLIVSFSPSISAFSRDVLSRLAQLSLYQDCPWTGTMVQGTPEPTFRPVSQRTCAFPPSSTSVPISNALSSNCCTALIEGSMFWQSKIVWRASRWDWSAIRVKLSQSGYNRWR